MTELLTKPEHVSDEFDERAIGAIALTSTDPEGSETEMDYGSLPDKQSTENIIRGMLENTPLPETYRITDTFEEANVIDSSIIDKEPDIHRLQNLFIAQTAQKAGREAWWLKMSDALDSLGASKEQLQDIPLIERHDMAIVVDGKPTDQGFEIFEVGGKEEDEEAARTVFEALKTVDQFSGGLLAASPQKPHVVLVNGIQLGQNNGGGETGGAAVPGVVVLNMPALKEMAREAGADFHALLATSTVHEILGHDLERLMHDRTGTYFSKHFDYSRQRQPGEIFRSVHESVVPKDKATDSQPVREYGKTNASEDFATSVDAAIAATMGWSKGIENLPRFKSENDAHRSDLALDLMRRAAEAALQYDHTPGIVGSELRYQTDEHGTVVGVEPARKIEIQTTPGKVAMEQEVQKLAKAYQTDVLLVNQGDFL